MSPAPVLGDPSFSADSDAGIIDERPADIKIINVRPLLVGVGNLPAHGGRARWGVYYSLSPNLVNWTRRRLLMKSRLAAISRCGSPISYPSLLDASSPTRNFETTGRRPYLFYTRFHNRSCRLTLNRDLVRRRVTFTR